MRSAWLILACGVIGGSPAQADAQAAAQAAGVTLRGIAFDSLHRAPLANAFITLGGARSTTSDERGRFAFDSVRPGTHALDLQHDMLDSIGLPGVSIRVSVTDGRERVVIAIPAFATLWRASCGDRAPPADSAFVYGYIRSARDARPLAAAAVGLTWIDVSLGPQREINQRFWRSEIRSDARGEYSICGVPVDMALRIQAVADSAASGIIDLEPSMLRVRRRDLLVGPADSTDVTQRGAISGIVTNALGAPFDGARVVLDDVPEVRTGPDGRFILRNVVAGTRQLELFAIGVRPVVIAVDLQPGETANVAATLERVTTLDVVRVTGSRFQQRFVREFEERRRSGFGSFVDSTVLGRRLTMVSALAGLSGVEVRSGRGGSISVTLPSTKIRRCDAGIWIDGWRADAEQLAALDPRDLAAIEVFPRASLVPLRFSGSLTGCGVVAIWTKNWLW